MNAVILWVKFRDIRVLEFPWEISKISPYVNIINITMSYFIYIFFFITTTNRVAVILEAVATQPFIHIPTEEIGLLLCVCKEMWRDSLLLACAVQLMHTMEKYTQRNSSNPLGVDSDRNNNIDVGTNHDRKPYSGIKRNIAEENKTIIDHPNEALFIHGSPNYSKM